MAKLCFVIVDDVKLNRLVAINIISDSLQRFELVEDVSFIQNENGQSALNTIKHLEQQSKSSDSKIIVIMDYEMPGINGLETAEGILDIVKDNPVFKENIALIGFSTSYTNTLASKVEDEFNDSLKLKLLKVFDGFLHKPMQRENCHETLKPIYIKFGFEAPRERRGSTPN